MKALFLLIFSSSMSFAVQTVPYVDLNRYVGKWFEVASIPARFQRKCVKNVTAVYRLLENGKVDVVNSCMKENGKLQVANGLAQVKNKETNAELGVSFVPFFNHFGWFEGQYKILALAEDYRYALVGTDDLKYGWILSRSPNPTKDDLAILEEEIRRQGYDSCNFLTSVQDGGLFNKRTPLCEIVKE